jgi:hypothetical protein
MRAAAAEAITWGTVPLLSFVDITGTMSVPDGHFEPPLAHDLETFVSPTTFFSVAFGRLAKTYVAASAFLFFRTSMETGTG